ncbi:uncharacterized protein [Diadema antillarum]|uniref:uncharacterized protein n=1 Tax=Diadema antillarum TaxID=105358 RepID=UPI003A84BA63
MAVYHLVKLAKKQRLSLLVLGLTMLCGAILLANRRTTFMSASTAIESRVSKVFVPDHDIPVVDALDKGCYLQTADMAQHRHSRRLLAERDCRQRLPSVLIAGGALCGTATFKSALSFHPDVVVREGSDPALLNVNSKEDDSNYRLSMPYSLPHQITVDSSREYMYSSKFRLILRKNLPGHDTKVIILIRDPVARAMTEYLVLSSNFAKEYYDEGVIITVNQSDVFREADITVLKKMNYRNYDGREKRSTRKRAVPSAHKKRKHKSKLKAKRRKKHRRQKRNADNQQPSDTDELWKLQQDLKGSFTETISDKYGSINPTQFLIERSKYGSRLRLLSFLGFRLLVLDAEAFARNPVNTMTLVELFLGLKPFYDRSFFDFDLSSGKLCFNAAEVGSCQEPIFLNRSIPTVPDQLVKDLREFFVPWMKMQHKVADAYFEHRGEHPIVLTPFR